MMLVIYYLPEPNSILSPYAYFCRETYLSVLIQMAQTHSRGRLRSAPLDIIYECSVNVLLFRCKFIHNTAPLTYPGMSFACRHRSEMSFDSSGHICNLSGQAANDPLK